MWQCPPGSESKKVISAHKFVLAISSPVFFAMFYGQIAETKNSIELPDCEYESLLELFRFMYTDEANLSGSNVMQVQYLANKYMVQSLAEKCTEYLRENLKASNVFCILPHAQKFEDKDLEDRCWEVIEKHTEEAVTSDEFVTLERSLVESVVKREQLKVKEVELFLLFLSVKAFLSRSLKEAWSIICTQNEIVLCSGNLYWNTTGRRNFVSMRLAPEILIYLQVCIIYYFSAPWYA